MSLIKFCPPYAKCFHFCHAFARLFFSSPYAARIRFCPCYAPRKLLLPNLCQSYSLFSHSMPMIFNFTLNPYAKHPCPAYAQPFFFPHFAQTGLPNPTLRNRVPQIQLCVKLGNQTLASRKPSLPNPPLRKPGLPHPTMRNRVSQIRLCVNRVTRSHFAKSGSPHPALRKPGFSTPTSRKPSSPNPASPKPCLPTLASPKPSLQNPALCKPAYPVQLCQTCFAPFAFR